MSAIKRSVVIVGSDEAHSLRLAGALRKHDFHVCLTDNPDHALSEAERGKIDFVLVDHCLPQINGIELTRRLKSRSADVGVLFVSQDLDLDMYIEEMNSGANDCLQKPCDMRDVVRVIEYSRLRPV